MSLTFSQIQPGMTVLATSKLRGEVKEGIVKYKSEQPFTPGAEVEEWIGLDIGGGMPFQNFSLKYWTITPVAKGGRRRTIRQKRSKRRQSKRSSR